MLASPFQLTKQPQTESRGADDDGMDRPAASSVRMAQQNPAPFLGRSRFPSEMLCKITEQTQNLVFLRSKIYFFSQILHKSQHYWELWLSCYSRHR